MGKVINVQMDEDFYNEIIQGGGSGSGEASSIEYLDVSGLDEENKIRLGMYSIVAKIRIQGVSYIVHSSEPGYKVGKEYLTHVAIDFTVKLHDSVVNSSNPKIVTLKELFLELGSTPITQEQLDAIPRITKEQFYSLE